ncbi:hypothetical protein ERUR111494_02930 [Erysipelothrix urinaevulpis]|uniref:hypothetical protein n=1 Tax=Erysipelothrix urinaevulpis TaxID=2683717 RepID=UPI001357199F|nr:hypothetical protein [Erysipelothrix urinaevulpis]
MDYHRIWKLYRNPLLIEMIDENNSHEPFEVLESGWISEITHVYHDALYHVYSLECEKDCRCKNQLMIQKYEMIDFKLKQTNLCNDDEHIIPDLIERYFNCFVQS